MNLSQRQLVIAAGSLAVILVLGFLIYSNLRPGKAVSASITVWGFDNPDVFGALIKSYNATRPNVQVTYAQVSQSDYDNRLLNALAAGQAPDVFPVRSRTLAAQINKLTPINPAKLTAAQLESLFPTVIEQDFVWNTSSSKDIYALPLYLDTLALLYHKNAFDQAGIVAPPKTWDEFQQMIPKLRTVGLNGQIRKAAAAIGGSQKTIGAGIDLLNVLMLQNGTPMVSPDLRGATFASRGENSPGLQAFNFYLQFADPRSPYYTWSESQPDSIESFSNNDVAMIFDYYRTVVELERRNPFSDIGIAPLPQPAGALNAINYADYWGLGVSKQSKVPAQAWDFILYATANPDVSRTYLGLVNEQPALRALIAANLNDAVWGIFSRQSLTARSWFEPDKTKVDDAFSNAIVNVLSGKLDSGRALRQAEDQITQLMAQGF